VLPAVVPVVDHPALDPAGASEVDARAAMICLQNDLIIGFIGHHRFEHVRERNGGLLLAAQVAYPAALDAAYDERCCF
jgi:hypothetical protein